MADLPEEKAGQGAKPIDIGSILLPKKEGAPSVDSAQRVNAGALLNQEQKATLLTPEGRSPQSPAPSPTVAPAKEGPAKAMSEINPLQTYQGDIESVVSERGVSVVSIAAAEADRAGKGQGGASPKAEEPYSYSTLSAVAGGVLLFAAAGALIAYVMTRPNSVPAEQQAQAPFIAVDESKAVMVAPDESRSGLMNKLQSAREATKLAVGLLEWLAPLRTTAGAAPQALTAAEFFHIIAPNAPPGLLRTLRPQYLLGIHSFDENQAFLILSVDSYETAYAGMLEWEYTMREDLAPLFTRTPSPSAGTPEAPYTELGQASVLQTGFVDKIVENRDTRAVVAPNGDILLLWTFLGRNLIVITTNEYTLRQVVSSLQAGPATP